MATLQIEEKNAKAAWKDADAAGKKLLAALFGDKVFSSNPFDRIKTFADVCSEAGVNEEDYRIPDTGTPEQSAAMYSKRLKLIAQVFNGDWKANMADTSQYKYYPWFRIDPNSSKLSGFGLSSYDCVYGCGATHSALGVRPYFKDSDTAIYVGKQFIAEYEGFAQYENLSNQ